MDPTVELIIDITLLSFMAATAYAVARLRNLYAVAMLFSIFSLLAASMFVLLDAVDVAFTEASVGTGISTVLILCTLALTKSREKQPRHTRVLPLLVVSITGAALVYGTLDLAHFGDPTAPPHQHVGPEYIARAPVETGIPNMVTSVLASYRGYDTLGEVTVIFTAGVGVVLLLGSWRRKEDDDA